LKDKVLRRLAEQRRPAPWRRIAAAGSIAAAVLLLFAAGLAWHLHGRTIVDVSFVQNYTSLGRGWSEEEVEKYFDQQGLRVRVPREIDCSKYLQRIEVVVVKGRPVAKLSYAGSETEADLLILPAGQFRTDGLTPDDPNLTPIQVRHEGDFTYLFFLHRGNFNDLLRPLQ
jgi:hypothetical protein